MWNGRGRLGLGLGLGGRGLGEGGGKGGRKGKRIMTIEMVVVGGGGGINTIHSLKTVQILVDNGVKNITHWL